MDDLLARYDTPLFWQFAVGTSLVNVVAFALFAAALTALAMADPTALRQYRIQSRAPRAQTLVWPSMQKWVVNNLTMLSTVVLLWPLLAPASIRLGAPYPRWYEVLWQVVLFVYLDDFLYYWMHRAMHTPWLMKRVHGVHHRIVTPWAITGNFMHPVEYVLTGLLALVGPILLGAHVITVWCWIAWRQWEAAEGHCGYDLPWSPTRLLPFNDGAAHHDWHHAKVRGNYAGFLNLWDRVFKTTAAGYDDDLARRKTKPSP